MYLAVECEAKVDYKEPLFFLREAPIEKKTTLECIRTVAATYACKILQLCEYEANEYG